MVKRRERVTVTVDSDFVEAAQRAIRAGRVRSLSDWINEALAERDHKERRIQALAEALEECESQFCSVSPEAPAAPKRALRAGGRRTAAA